MSKFVLDQDDGAGLPSLGMSGRRWSIAFGRCATHGSIDLTPNKRCRRSEWIVAEVCIARCPLRLRVAEESTNNDQTLSFGCTKTGERVAKVVDPQIGQTRSIT